LKRVPALLRRDANFAWYLAARALGAVSGMGAAFYTVYALRAWQAPPATVGLFTVLLLAGSIAGTLVLGWVADRAGHVVVVITGVAAAAAANALALGAPSLGVFGFVFVLSGVQQASASVSGLNVLLEFAPAEREDRPISGSARRRWRRWPSRRRWWAACWPTSPGFPSSS
jgi:MFS family permease